MTRKDQYYNRAKQEGYRTRAAYKLQQLDEEAHLFGHGDTVVDLGAAPGGWLQVAAERVGTGTVVGVDLQRIDDLEADNVETVRGDMTEDGTKLKLQAALDPEFDGRAGAYEPREGDRPADIVISDMAPNMTGEYELDHARSVHLARQAFETALDLLAPGGDLVVKVFDGPDLAALRADMEGDFQYVRTIHPEASRDSSSETYLVAKGRTDAPVAEGEQVEVDIVGEGEEGDGIAKLDGYTLFVPGAESGESVTVTVTDLKPRFGFAERVE
jgi:23S rRNA (uridine2552-2'-O)-methyltransferase